MKLTNLLTEHKSDFANEKTHRQFKKSAEKILQEMNKIWALSEKDKTFRYSSNFNYLSNNMHYVESLLKSYMAD